MSPCSVLEKLALDSQPGLPTESEQGAQEVGKPEKLLVEVQPVEIKVVDQDQKGVPAEDLP